MNKRTRNVLVVAFAVLMAVPVVAFAADRFNDVPDTNIFHEDIGWLADAGVTLGCNPPDNDEFCPEDPVKRQQMAAFMRRFAAYLGAEDGIVSEADHAATADSATTAGDADMLDGLPPTEYRTSFSVAAGSFIDGTAVDLTSGDTVIAASAEITVPEAGVLIVTNSSSWDIGEFVIHDWTELDTTPGCDPDYFGGDPLPGSFGADASDDSVATEFVDDRANAAGLAAVEVPSAGTYTVHHCLQLFSGASAINLDHSLSVEWVPVGSASIAAVAGVRGPNAPAGGSSSR